MLTWTLCRLQPSGLQAVLFWLSRKRRVYVMAVSITTYHLEMLDPGELRPKRIDRGDLEIKRAEIPCPELSRFLYSAVGGDWYWIDRLGWSHRQWLDWLDRPELETWVAYLSGTPAGYFELEAQPQGNVEIAYFGVLTQFIGQGIGGHLLTAAVERAWAMGASRVWVHTCTHDHPGALANYLARGFRLFREEMTTKDLPAESPGPWPGAGRRP
jgi:GNAT superfamily N-acetyltransferase